jgi:hypothetical protein
MVICSELCDACKRGKSLAVRSTGSFTTADSSLQLCLQGAKVVVLHRC